MAIQRCKGEKWGVHTSVDALALWTCARHLVMATKNIIINVISQAGEKLQFRFSDIFMCQSLSQSKTKNYQNQNDELKCVSPSSVPCSNPIKATKKLLYVLQFTPVHRQDADNRRGLTIDVIMDQAKPEILKTSSNLKIVNFTKPSKNLRERKFIENLRKFVAKSIIIFIKIICILHDNLCH